MLCIYDHLYLYKVHWAHFLHMPHLIYIGIHTYYCYIYYYIVHFWKSILSAKKHIWENLVQRRKDAYAKSAIPHSFFQLANVSTYKFIEQDVLLVIERRGRSVTSNLWEWSQINNLVLFFTMNSILGSKSYIDLDS